MYRHRRKPRMARPFHSLHGAIWMIGLAILFINGWWWPGILILIGIGILLEGLSAGFTSQSLDDTDRPEVPSPLPPASPPLRPSPPPVPFLQTSVVPEYHPFERLPGTCPRCGGPVRRDEVRWTGPQSAACAYCGSSLPLRRN